MDWTVVTGEPWLLARKLLKAPLPSLCPHGNAWDHRAKKAVHLDGSLQSEGVNQLHHDASMCRSRKDITRPLLTVAGRGLEEWLYNAT